MHTLLVVLSRLREDWVPKGYTLRGAFRVTSWRTCKEASPSDGLIAKNTLASQEVIGGIPRVTPTALGPPGGGRMAPLLAHPASAVER